MTNLNLITATVEGNTRDNLVAALASIGECDADFCGENGNDYLWPAAKSAGYETNLDYVLDRELKSFDGEKLVKKFFESWLDHDSYYEDYEFDIQSVDGQIKFIAFSYVN